MSEYTSDLESIDMERYMEAKHSVTCVSCADVVPEDGDWHYICEDIYCHQCVIDADIVGHTYG